MRRLVLPLLALLLTAGKLDRLTEGEYAHYRALRVFMDDGDRKDWLKLKTTELRDQSLKDAGLWDKFYGHDAETRAKIVEGDVRLGWSRDMVYMAWGPPFQRQRLPGRQATRSELFVYRFEIFADGSAEPLVGRKTDHKAVDHHQTEVTVDDDVVAEIVEKERWE